MNRCSARTTSRSQICHNMPVVEWVTLGDEDGHKYKCSLCRVHLRMANTQGVLLFRPEKARCFPMRLRGEKWGRMKLKMPPLARQ